MIPSSRSGGGARSFEAEVEKRVGGHREVGRRRQSALQSEAKRPLPYVIDFFDDPNGGFLLAGNGRRAASGGGKVNRNTSSSRPLYLRRWRADRNEVRDRRLTAHPRQGAELAPRTDHEGLVRGAARVSLEPVPQTSLRAWLRSWPTNLDEEEMEPEGTAKPPRRRGERAGCGSPRPAVTFGRNPVYLWVAGVGLRADRYRLYIRQQTLKAVQRATGQVPGKILALQRLQLVSERQPGDRCLGPLRSARRPMHGVVSRLVQIPMSSPLFLSGDPSSIHIPKAVRPPLFGSREARARAGSRTSTRT